MVGPTDAELMAERHTVDGSHLAESKRWDDAIRAFQEAANLSPRAAAVLHNLGVAYAGRARDARNQEDREADLRAASGHFRAALDLDPGNPVSLRCLGLTLYDWGRLEESIEVTAQAVRSNPGDAPGAYNLAWIQHRAFWKFVRQGRWRRAWRLVPQLRRSLSLLRGVTAEELRVKIDPYNLAPDTRRAWP